MKKNLIVLLVAIMSLSGLGIANAAIVDTVSFINVVENVDGDISSWSVDNSLSYLGVNSWSLLGGAATVNAYSNGARSGMLTHRGTRGLGVQGGEQDEVDYHYNPESIQILFANDYELKNFEVRSLFTPENESTEVGAVDLFLDGQLLQTIGLSASPLGGVNGILQVSVGSVLVDKIVFYGQSQSALSDFAVAKLNNPVPEPMTMLLFGPALLGLVGLKKKKS